MCIASHISSHAELLCSFQLLPKAGQGERKSISSVLIPLAAVTRAVTPVSFFFSKGSLLQLCPTSVTTRKVEISAKFDGKRFGLELFKLDYWGFRLSAARLYGFLRGGRQIWMHVTRLIPDCFIVIHVKTCRFQFADIITLVVDLLNKPLNRFQMLNELKCTILSIVG